MILYPDSDLVFVFCTNECFKALLFQTSQDFDLSKVSNFWALFELFEFVYQVISGPYLSSSSCMPVLVQVQ